MVLVRHILEAARRRLAVLGREASLFDAAEILANPNTPLAVVCDREDIAVGVISRDDIVRVLANARVAALGLNAGAIMSNPVLTCRLDDPLDQVWAGMNSHSLRCIALLDDVGRARGIVHAHDVARAVLDEVSYEEALLRDYVLGIGYQ